MATIYNGNMEKVCIGLPSLERCDEAMHIARREAIDRQEPVLLDDNGDQWWVYPDGDVDAVGDDE
jgi:hypothetical protein